MVDSGHPGAEEANAPQLALRTWDSTSSVRGCAGRQLVASELVPPCLILGGVEQPKRRRRALNRGGGKKASCQLQNLKPRGARGAAKCRRRIGRRRRGRGPGAPAAHLFATAASHSHVVLAQIRVPQFSLAPCLAAAPPKLLGPVPTPTALTLPFFSTLLFRWAPTLTFTSRLTLSS